MSKIENMQHVREIADRLEAIAEGRAYFDDDGDLFVVDSFEDIPEDLEPLGMFDYFNDMLDINYLIDSEREYLGAIICVAWGGPSIYVDTVARSVRLHWWGESAECALAGYVVDAVDDFARELYEC